MVKLSPLTKVLLLLLLLLIRKYLAYRKPKLQGQVYRECTRSRNLCEYRHKSHMAKKTRLFGLHFTTSNYKITATSLHPQLSRSFKVTNLHIR